MKDFNDDSAGNRGTHGGPAQRRKITGKVPNTAYARNPEKKSLGLVKREQVLAARIKDFESLTSSQGRASLRKEGSVDQAEKSPDGFHRPGSMKKVGRPGNRTTR